MTTLSNATDLNADVWRLEEIAEYLRLPSVKAAYPVVKRAGFPMSIVPGARNRRWLSKDVKDFLKLPAKEIGFGSSIKVTNDEPQIIHKHRKVHAA